MGMGLSGIKGIVSNGPEKADSRMSGNFSSVAETVRSRGCDLEPSHIQPAVAPHQEILGWHPEYSFEIRHFL